MTKLTTERLSKLRDNLLQFQDSYSDPADKENYDIFVDALHVIDEFKIAKEKILAYEQAAKNPAEYKVVSRFGDISLRNQKCEAEMYRSMKGFSVTPLYAAPALPKQPESRNEIMAKGVEAFAKDWKGSARYSRISEMACNFAAKLRNGDADEC